MVDLRTNENALGLLWTPLSKKDRYGKKEKKKNYYKSSKNILKVSKSVKDVNTRTLSRNQYPHVSVTYIPKIHSLSLSMNCVFSSLNRL